MLSLGQDGYCFHLRASTSQPKATDWKESVDGDFENGDAKAARLRPTGIFQIKTLVGQPVEAQVAPPEELSAAHSNRDQNALPPTLSVGPGSAEPMRAHANAARSSLAKTEPDPQHSLASRTGVGTASAVESVVVVAAATGIVAAVAEIQVAHPAKLELWPSPSVVTRVLVAAAVESAMGPSATETQPLGGAWTHTTEGKQRARQHSAVRLVQVAVAPRFPWGHVLHPLW